MYKEYMRPLLFLGSVLGLSDVTKAFAGLNENRLPFSRRAAPRVFAAKDANVEDSSILSDKLSQELANEAVAWSAVNGFQMVDPSSSDAAVDGGGPVNYVHVPFSLLPNAVPRSEFNRAVELAPLFNLLVDAVACDQDWLAETLKPVLASDPFTAKLVELMLAAPKQSVRLGLHRSDYMVDGPSGSILQVELNTIASSFGCVSSRATALHQHLLARFLDSKDPHSASEIAAALATLATTYTNVAAAESSANTDDATTAGDAAAAELSANDMLIKAAGFNELSVEAPRGDGSSSSSSTMLGSADLPPNPSVESLAGAIAAAHNLYSQRRALPRSSSSTQQDGRASEATRVVLFVVQFGERNVVDQRLLELALWTNHNVHVKRATLAEIDSKAQVDPASGALMLYGQEVSVAYFRAGYTPVDYPTSSEWDARAKLESSSAVKCPTLAYQIAGTKKVQQQLAQPGEVEKFFARVVDSAAYQGAACWSVRGWSDFAARDVDDDVIAAAAALRGCFAALHPAALGAREDKSDPNALAAAAAAEDAIACPDGWVLKPQREGGGNNWYGDDMVAKLQAKVDLDDLILMQRILPPPQPARLVRKGVVDQGGPTLSELGVFGTFLAVDNDNSSSKDEDANNAGQSGASVVVLVNEYAGHILRTKSAGVDEGGVATGYSVLSSPILV